MRNITKISIGITSAILVLTMPLTTLAQAPALRGATSTGSAQQARVTKLQQRADAEITRRLTTLNNLLVRINNSAKLSVADKTTLSTEISGEIATLQTLKTKIDSDTDIATLRTDVKSIVEDYRVYLLVMPQVALMIGADTVLSNGERMASISAKLQALVDQAPATDKNSTVAKSALTDLNAKIADAQKLATGISTNVLPLTPQSYQTSGKALLQTSRTQLYAAHKDLTDGRRDIATVLNALKSIVKSASSSATTSATPTI